MASRVADWFNQSMRDLDFAEQARASGHHEWACFAAQQSAEKAVKALHLHYGQDAWGHVVAQLLADLPSAARVPDELIEVGRVLDNFYIPTRYPNSHPAGAPFTHYGPIQSEEAIRRVRQITDFVKERF